jgi:uncharacterized membrane protein YhhN
MLGSIVTAVGTLWLVTAIRRGHGSRALAKPLASSGFLLIVAMGPLDPGWRAGLLVAGLVLGAIGDLALMGRSDAAFLVGLGAFLAGHVAYLVAFSLDVEWGVWPAVGAAIAIALGVGVTRWLRPHLSPPFTLAVPVYIVVICLMLAAGVGSGTAHPLAALGAVLFAASDLFVARERFVAAGMVNPTLGLPLYYLAQTLIALSAVAF